MVPGPPPTVPRGRAGCESGTRGHATFHAGDRAGRPKGSVIATMRARGMTMVIVSHEMQFAREVADRVVFMNEGVIVEENTPDELFNRPARQRTRDFLARVVRH